MKYLNKKLRRDIFLHWTQFFSVFLMAHLSVLLFVGMQGGWRGLEVSLNNFIESSYLPDAWVFALGFTEADISEIENIPGIESTIEKTRVLATVQNDQTQYIWLDTFNPSSVIPYLVEGEEISNNASAYNGIWINREYARENDITVGQTLRIRLGGVENELEVLGIIQSADRIYFTGTHEYIAPNSNYGYGFISEDVLQVNFAHPWPHNLLEIRGSYENIRERLEEVLGERHLGFFDRDTLLYVSEPLARVGQFRNLSFLFSSIFILLAVLAMYTTIRRLIETQTKEIAVLKALGFSNRSVGIHYGSYGLLVGGGGALTGAIISPFMSWFVIGTQQPMLSIPEWEISYSMSSLVVIIAVISICVIAAFFASKEAIESLPALFLRGIEKRGRKILLENIRGLWSRFKFASRWAIRDAAVNRVRLIMGIIGVIGSMMLLMTGFGMPASMNDMLHRIYTEEVSNDLIVEFEAGSYERVRDNYEGQWVHIIPARITPDDGHDRLLTVLGEGDYLHMQTVEGEEIGEDGAYITEGFARRAGLNTSDEITIVPSFDGDEYTFTIAGILTREINQGIVIRQATWEEAGGEFAPLNLLISGYDSVPELEDDPNVVVITRVAEQEENARDFFASFMGVFAMIISFAVLLVVVVLYNLGSLSFVERTRDYATLRVLGFHKKELRNITMIENVATTFVGWILGIPLGFWFMGQYVRTFSTIQLEYTPYNSIWVFVFASIVAWLCSLSTTFFISRRIQKLDMVEALKGVE